MAEMFKSKRVKFPFGKQKAFLIKTKKTLRLKDEDLAKLLKISIRTLTDWKREKFHISLRALKLLSQKTKISMPQTTKILEPFWYTTKGASAGGIAVYKKYGYVGGDSEARKKKWLEWWNKIGRFKKHPIINVSKPIKNPGFSEDLAEFTGIVMGDGGLTNNQLVITLNYKDDSEYSKFVEKIIKKLFDIRACKLKRKNTKVFIIRISRVELVRFCTKIGLKIGNKIKQQIDIPDWIKANSKFKIACLRGLIDTDGCVIIHKYRSRGKYYTYKKIAFTNRSLPLLKSVSAILNELNFKHRIGNNFDIRIEAMEDVRNYFKIVGTHNPKHLKRYNV